MKIYHNINSNFSKIAENVTIGMYQSIHITINSRKSFRLIFLLKFIKIQFYLSGFHLYKISGKEKNEKNTANLHPSKKHLTLTVYVVVYSGAYPKKKTV